MPESHLSVGNFGEDVTRLQEKLRSHGFDIPATERDRKFFGPATRRAVLECQKEHGLRGTGVVDTATNLALEKVVATRSKVAQPLRIPAAGVAGTPAQTLSAVGVSLPNGEPPSAAGPPVSSQVFTTQQRPPSCVPARPTSFTVSGHVLQADGSPYPGGIVRSFDRHLRGSERPLDDEATTDECGYYQIICNPERHRQIGNNGVALIVRVFAPTGQEVSASSDIFEVRPMLTVDLVVGAKEYREPSEYERLMVEIKPHLTNMEGLEIPLADLDRKDLALLAGKTRISSRQIAFLIIAAKHAKQLDGETRNRPLLPAEVFYGLFRQGLPTKLEALLFQRARRQREALEASLRENIIPASLSTDLDKILETLHSLIGQNILRAKQNGNVGFVGLLQTSGVTQPIQEKFMSIWLRHEGSRQDFWTAVQQNPDFQKNGLADDLKFTLQMGILTRNNIPLVASLQGLRRRGTIQTSRDLVKVKAAEWETMIASAKGDNGIHFPPGIPGETEEEKMGHYANAIIETLRDAFPTDYVFQGVAEEPTIDATLVTKLLKENPNFEPRKPVTDSFKWGDLTTSDRQKANASLDALRREMRMFPELDHKEFLSRQKDRNPLRKDLSRFFANVPEFEFRDTHIDTFLAREGKRAFAGIERKEAISSQLKRLQRVFLVAPRYEQMRALLEVGLHSSFAIASVPVSKFVKEMGPLLDGETYAISIHSGAAQKRAMNMHITASAHQEFFDYTPAVISGGKKKDSKL